MSFREHLGIDDGELLLHTCDWCGKQEVSFWWSGSKNQYCSFRCFAAGSYRRNMLISAIVITMTSIFLLMSVILMTSILPLVLTSPFQGNPNDLLFLLVFIAPLAVLIGINIALAFTVFVGRSLRRERQVSELSES